MKTRSQTSTGVNSVPTKQTSVVRNKSVMKYVIIKPYEEKQKVAEFTVIIHFPTTSQILHCLFQYYLIFDVSFALTSIKVTSVFLGS